VLNTTTAPLVVDTARRSGLAGLNATSVTVKVLLVPCRTSKLHSVVTWSPSTRSNCTKHPQATAAYGACTATCWMASPTVNAFVISSIRDDLLAAVLRVTDRLPSQKKWFQETAAGRPTPAKPWPLANLSTAFSPLSSIYDGSSKDFLRSHLTATQEAAATSKVSIAGGSNLMGWRKLCWRFFRRRALI